MRWIWVVRLPEEIVPSIGRQSVKKPNLWNSEPVSTLEMVALCSGDFKLHSATSSIMPWQLVIELHTSERVCLVLSVIFCKLINEGSWGATHLRQILFQIGKNVYGDFTDVATGLWRGLFESYAMSRVVPAFQIGKNFHRRRPQIWTAFHVNEWRSH